MSKIIAAIARFGRQARRGGSARPSSDSSFIIPHSSFIILFAFFAFLSAAQAGTNMVSAGGDHSAAVKANGTVWTWGLNSQGQLGVGNLITTNRPVQVTTLTGVTAVAAGRLHTFALMSNSSLRAWGYNINGQLGDNTVIRKTSPISVWTATATQMVAIAAGWSNSLALKSDGTLWAWGNNRLGQLGDVSIVNRLIPVQVSNLTGVAAMAGGNAHSLAVTTNGLIYVWGWNTNGILGLGNLIATNRPTQNTNLSGVAAVAAGDKHSLALKTDGTVWSWGFNASGQLGIGSTNQKTTPILVSNLAGVVAIAAGFSNSLALKNDGTVWAWGNNRYGQLCDGTTSNRYFPTLITNLTNVSSMAGGAGHGLAYQTDATFWSWGLNVNRQLGNGTAINTNKPVRVIGPLYLPDPTGVSAADGSVSNIPVSWNAVAGATGYQLWRANVNSPFKSTNIAALAGTSFVDSNSVTYVTNYYFVVATNTIGRSGYSDADYGFSALSVPTNVTATDGTLTNQIVITWNAVGGATGYQVWKSAFSDPATAAWLAADTASPYTNIAVTANVPYYYWVAATNTRGVSAFSLSNSGYAAMACPTNVLASDGTLTNTVRVTWNFVTNATGFEVWRATNNNPALAIALGPTAVTNYNDASAIPGFSYWYWAQATNEYGASVLSLSNSGYAQMAPATNVAASDGTSSTQVQITWDAVSGALGYQVLRATNSNPALAVTVGVSSVASYDDASVTPARYYTFWVKATNALSVSKLGDSNSGYATLSAPINVLAGDGALTNAVTITWDASPGASGYQIWRNTSSDPGSAAQLGSAGVLSYTDNTAVPLASYYYWVKATNTLFVSGFSGSNTGYAAMAIPTGLTATDGSQINNVRVNWSAAPGVAGYDIQRATNSDPVLAASIGGTATTNYDDGTAIPGIIYWYWARGTNTYGNGTLSVSNSGYAQLAPATNMAATDGLFTGKVAITWTAPSGALGYQVLRSTNNNYALATTVGVAAVTNYDDSTVVPALLYFYWVKATNALTISALSDSNSGHCALDPATNMAASDGALTNAVLLSWDAVSNATGYQVWRGLSSDPALSTNIAAFTGTVYTDNTAVALAVFTYWVKATNSLNVGFFSESNTGYAVMDIPTGLTATAGTQTNNVRVNWIAAPGVAGYDIQRATNSDPVLAASIGGTTSTNYDDGTAIPGLIYWYWARGTNAYGNGTLSVSNSGYAQMAPATNVAASDGTSSTQIQITWTAVTGALGYQVLRATNGNPTLAVTVGVSAAASYDDASVTPAQYYYYWVRATNALTIAALGDSNSGYATLSAPLNVLAGDGALTNAVTITWDASAGASGYQIWRNTSSDPGTAAQLGSAGVLSYTDNTAVPLASYYYWVKATNALFISGFSESNSGYAAMAIPTGLTATDGTQTNNVRIVWSAVAGPDGYDVLRSTTSDPGTAASIGGTTATNYDDGTATPGLIYWYWARGTNTYGNGTLSVSNSGYAQMAPAANVAATDGTLTNTVQVTWDGVSGALGYRVLRCTNSNPALAVELGQTAGTNYDDASGTPLAVYYYWAQATNSLSAAVLSLSNSGYAAMAAPTSVTAGDGTYTNYVAVSWAAVSGATGYQVWRYTNSSLVSAVQIGSAAGLSYDDYSVVMGPLYYYWIKATNSLGVGATSSPDTGYVQTPIPSAPLNVVASDDTYSNKVAVSWDASGGAASYEVWRNGTINSNTAIKVAEVAATSYDDDAVLPNMTFYYWLKAKNASGASPFSAPDTGSARLSTPTGTADIAATNLVFLPPVMRVGQNPDSVTLQVSNNGPDPLGFPDSSVQYAFTLSANAVFGDGDDVAMGSVARAMSLETGGSTVFRLTYEEQSSLAIPAVAPGAYYVFARVSHAAPSTLTDGNAGNDVALRVGTIRIGATAGAQAAMNDYNGDGISDLAIYDPPTGGWYIRTLAGSSLLWGHSWGGPGMAAVPGDFDADGAADMAVYYEPAGYWFVRKVNGALLAWGTAWGGNGMTPVSGDFNNDGASDLAVYHENSGYWFVGSATSSAVIAWGQLWGAPGYAPVPGDFDGNGASDLAVYNEDTTGWYVTDTANSNIAFGVSFGGPGLAPVPGDYDGDGNADIAVYHIATGAWFIRTVGGTILSWGNLLGGSGFVPVPGDYNGDGASDLAVYHEATGTWYITQLDGAVIAWAVSWGVPGMSPVGAVW